jgi:hypothetical protein
MAGLNLHGEERVIDGRRRVHYDGYWIKTYPVPADSMLAKKQLIEALTRRLFNHVEHGVNIPGRRLEEARSAFDSEADVQRKRVKGAMLAGALFNRATDIFTKLVEIQALGVRITPDNLLMRECGDHLQEALQLGKMVRHRSGEEGIDELWGEPFKAFAFPVEDFYRSRYIKIAMTMREIDRICGCLESTFDGSLLFDGIAPLLRAFALAAKAKSETLRTDEDMFEVWTSFVTSAEDLSNFDPRVKHAPTFLEQQESAEGCQLVREGKDLVSYIARARVPMPKSAQDFIGRCGRYRRIWLANAKVDKAG